MTIQEDLNIATPNALHVFSEQHWQQVQHLLESLNDSQAMWLSGFLAAGKSPAAAVIASNAPKILIAYGTETGNSKALAEQLAQLLSTRQLSGRVTSLAELKPRALARFDFLLLICSTHGDGDPPEPTLPFFEALMENHAPRLENTGFAVLALGDSSYEQYCTAGARLDERFEQLGAKRLVDRRECDVDFQQPAAEWMQQVLAALPSSAATVESSVAALISTPSIIPASITPELGGALVANLKTYNKQNPLLTEVLTNIRLSDSTRSHPVHHLELLLDVEGFHLEPGDAVGIVPHNPPELVAAVLDASGLSGDEAIMLDGKALPLVQALREQLDLTIPNQHFLDYWAGVSGSETLRHEADADVKIRRAFLRQHQLLELLQCHPGIAEAQALANVMRPLQPRLYDVANYVVPDTDEIHLVVKAYDYEINQKQVTGIASQYLLQLQPGETASIYPHHNKRFHLPDQHDVPLIFIGCGTGVAPYRAFAQQIAESERSNPCWLVFGEQSFEHDFLYQLDWQQASARGVLQRLDTVFADDQPNRQLSDPLIEQCEELAQWIARGAHIYLCGDKDTLTRCEAALQPSYNQLNPPMTWQELDREKRIHRNLY